MVKEMAKDERVQLKSAFRSWAIFIAFFSVIILVRGTCMADAKNYAISERADGGDAISISYSKRVWKPKTAEGVFPQETGTYELNLVGKGEDWSGEGEPGSFYPLSKIESRKTHWEVGFAWVDKDRSLIYLNLFWVSPPDKLEPMAINGVYKIKR